MELYPKSGNILYILNVLKKYSDEDHKLSISTIKSKVKEEYGEITIRSFFSSRAFKYGTEKL